MFKLMVSLLPFVLSLSKHVPLGTPFDKLRANGRGIEAAREKFGKTGNDG